MGVRTLLGLREGPQANWAVPGARMRSGDRVLPGGKARGLAVEATMWGRSAARLLLAAGLGAVLEALACWLARRLSGKRPAVCEVLFFPERASCVEALLAEHEHELEPSLRRRRRRRGGGGGGPPPSPPPCACPLPHGESALGRLLVHVLSARRSLELCLFAFTCPQLRRAVVLVHRRGARVRAVADTDYMGVRGSQVGELRRAGIQVRHDQEAGYMHHKFAIIDKKKLITGSLNWTTQAIQSNRENVLIVEDRNCVNIFIAEFEKIWEHYNPANYTFFPQGKKEASEDNKTFPGTKNTTLQTML